MKTSKLLLLLVAQIVFYPSIGQNFAIQQTNTGKKSNASQYINAAKKCKLVLLKKQTLYTLAISSKSTLTTSSVNKLAEKFANAFPKGIDPLKGDERVVERGFENKEDVVQMTYCVMGANQYTTTDYVQMAVFFDSSGPNPVITNIQVRNKADLGVLELTEREIHPPVVKPPAPVVKAPVTKTPGTKAKTPATKKPATKKPAAKTPAVKKPAVKKS